MLIDARLPVRFGSVQDRVSGDAVLTDQPIETAPPYATFTLQAGQIPDCLCCTARNGAAVSLSALFRERAVGQGPPFRSVLAVVGREGEAAIRTALRDDPLASGRFRLA